MQGTNSIFQNFFCSSPVLKAATKLFSNLSSFFATLILVPFIYRSKTQ